MTDEELKKSLQCCAANDGFLCGECPYYKNGHACEEVSNDALRLINNLESENAVLRDKLEKVCRETARALTERVKGYFEDSLAICNQMDELLEEYLKGQAQEATEK